MKQRRVPASVRQQFLNRSSSLYTVGEYIREKLRNYELLRYRDNSRNSSNPSFKLKGPVQDKIIGLATKWLRILPLGGIDKIRNRLVSNLIVAQMLTIISI